MVKKGEERRIGSGGLSKSLGNEWVKGGANDGKRPKSKLKKMPMEGRPNGTWGGGVGRP